MPRKGEVSVAHIFGLAEEEVWAVGQHTLSVSTGRTQVRGRADLPVAAVRGVSLRAARDDVGFERHSAITGWPGGDDADVRHKELAKELAMVAKLVIRYRRPERWPHEFRRRAGSSNLGGTDATRIKCL
ncbi:MAG: hypothetical protein EPN33_08305 [Acidobacteria bacterium]|nr:MAG: hypothetical protein EPN33_08305 [Acidobacteriota bacterium]